MTHILSPAQRATVAAIRAQDRRVRLLEAMYRLDGRESPLHPLHRRYTGLAVDLPEPAKRMLNLFTNWRWAD